MSGEYTAEEGSKCEFCDAPAVHRILETNTCDDSRCKYMAWTEDHEDHG